MSKLWNCTLRVINLMSIRVRIFACSMCGSFFLGIFVHIAFSFPGNEFRYYITLFTSLLLALIFYASAIYFYKQEQAVYYNENETNTTYTVYDALGVQHRIPLLNKQPEDNVYIAPYIARTSYLLEEEEDEEKEEGNAQFELNPGRVQLYTSTTLEQTPLENDRIRLVDGENLQMTPRNTTTQCSSIDNHHSNAISSIWSSGFDSIINSTSFSMDRTFS